MKFDMDFVAENGIELAVSVVDDEEFERFSNELREDVCKSEIE